MSARSASRLSTRRSAARCRAPRNSGAIRRGSLRNSGALLSEVPLTLLWRRRCTHIFHVDCARGWLGEAGKSTDGSCPLCKAPLLQGELLERAEQLVNADADLRGQLVHNAINQLGIHDLEAQLEAQERMAADAHDHLGEASRRAAGLGRSSTGRMSDYPGFHTARRGSDAASELPMMMPSATALRNQGAGRGGDFREIAALGRERSDDSPASPGGGLSEESMSGGYAANYERSVEMPGYARGRSAMPPHPAALANERV